MTRYFSNIATPTTLAAGINNTDVTSTITVSDALTGWPASRPYTAIIDKDTASEEMVLITVVNGTTLTATRGVHGYGKYAHSSGAVFSHAASAQDLTDFQAHVDGSRGLTCGQATRTATQAMAHITWYTVAFNSFTNEYVNGSAQSMHSGTDWVLPYTGLWHFSACITVPNVSAYWSIKFTDANDTILAQTSRDPFFNDKMSLTCARYLTSGTHVLLKCYQDSAGTITLPVDSAGSPCYFSASLSN